MFTHAETSKEGESALAHLLAVAVAAATTFAFIKRAKDAKKKEEGAKAEEGEAEKVAPDAVEEGGAAGKAEPAVAEPSGVGLPAGPAGSPAVLEVACGADHP